MSIRTNVKDYYYLTKPGIVRGNDLSAIAGFLLGSKNNFQLGSFLFMLAGISLVMASACVYNNYIDVDIDRKMKRTKNRALVTGRISGRAALLYATTLGVLGLSLLAFGNNVLSSFIALFGMVAYVVIYGVAKRGSEHGTVVGSISGAIPPVVGYVAATGRIDMAAALLFLVLVFWQMPHFYAISIFRAKEYKAAGIPVLPLRRGMHNTKVQMLLYIIGFAASSVLLNIYGYTGWTYLLVMLAASIFWLYFSVHGFRVKDDDRWAKQMFGISLLTLLLFSAAVSLNALLP